MSVQFDQARASRVKRRIGVAALLFLGVPALIAVFLGLFVALLIHASDGRTWLAALYGVFCVLPLLWLLRRVRNFAVRTLRDG